MRSLIALFLTLVLVAAACSGSDDSYEVIFEPGECELAGPEVPVADECGWLVVPENRADPDNADTIRLHVAIFRSDAAEAKPDAMVYLHGGPGGPAIWDIVPRVETLLEPLAGDRDVVVFDQRGTGYSQPALSCPEVVEAQLEVVATDMSVPDAEAVMHRGFEACRDRLVADGVDLTAYNDAESAADVADLRRVLGYDEWNLYGGSYGARLALSVLRYHPDGVRAVVLEGVEPPQVDPAFSDDILEVFEDLFARCAADDGCAAAFGDLEGLMQAAVERYDTNPATVSVAVDPSAPARDVLVDGHVVLAGVATALNETTIVPFVPLLIGGAANGVPEIEGVLAEILLGNILYDRFAMGTAVSFHCHDEVVFYDAAELADLIDGLGYLGDVVKGRLGTAFPDTADGYFPVCELWGAGAADAVENEPVASDVPALVLNGTYDTYTPVSGARLAAETLPNSYLVEFPAFGHSVTEVSDCGMAIARSFLDDPSTPPDGSCVDDLTVEFMTEIPTS